MDIGLLHFITREAISRKPFEWIIQDRVLPLKISLKTLKISPGDELSCQEEYDKACFRFIVIALTVDISNGIRDAKYWKHSPQQSTHPALPSNKIENIFFDSTLYICINGRIWVRKICQGAMILWMRLACVDHIRYNESTVLVIMNNGIPCAVLQNMLKSR